MSELAREKEYFVGTGYEYVRVGMCGVLMKEDELGILGGMYREINLCVCNLKSPPARSSYSRGSHQASYA